jgi:7-carboxy-7-deazaguanine synthase
MEIIETFYSIQGEGAHIGKPTFFIRTAVCNLRCSWCDTKYSWERGQEVSVRELLRRVEKTPTRDVCLTGGEPLLWPDAPELVAALAERGYRVVVETSGSVSIAKLPRNGSVCVSMDIKCPSSGMEEKMAFENLRLLRPGDQLKFVIADRRDYEYARALLEEHGPASEVVLQPEGGRRLLPLAEWVLRDGLPVRVLPQLHKLIWPEKDRGV